MEGGTVEGLSLLMKRLFADVVYQTGNDFSYELGQVIPPPEIVNEDIIPSIIIMIIDKMYLTSVTV